MKNFSVSSVAPAIAALGAIALLPSMALRDTATTEAAGNGSLRNGKNEK